MSKFFVELILGILKLIFPSIREGMKDSNTTAVEEDEGLEDRLRDRVDNHWGHCWIIFMFSFMLVGCGTRTVYVPDGTPVKLRESLKGVKIWVKDKDGNTIATEMDVPEGWFILPDKKED